MSAIDETFKANLKETGLTDADYEAVQKSWKKMEQAYKVLYNETIVELVKAGFYTGYAFGRADD